jgi:hypothetical protein
MLYYNKALKTFGDAQGSLYAYNGIGKLYYNENKFDQAIEIS